MNKTTTPSRSEFAVLRQICNLIPSYLVPKLARETGVDKRARTFSPWSHLVSLIYAHLTHAIHVVDSTTIALVASCMDWAKHRRRKAAAKCHLRLDLHSFLPRFAIIDTARENDAKRSRELCAAIRAGEIVVFDKAYVDFAHPLASTEVPDARRTNFAKPCAHGLDGSLRR